MVDEPLHPNYTDHDRLIDLDGRARVLEKEIQSLRDWRHDTIAPVMIAIQAQQKQNASDIGKLTESISALAASIQPLASLPAELNAHATEDKASFSEMTRTIKNSHTELAVSIEHNAAEARTGHTELREKMDHNRSEGQAGQRQIILWIAGIVIAGLASVVAIEWAFISPHLNWN